jgi:hypothetical protein
MVTAVTYTLSFVTKHSYDTTKIGITVPVPPQERRCGTRAYEWDG